MLATTHTKKILLFQLAKSAMQWQQEHEILNLISHEEKVGAWREITSFLQSLTLT